MQPVGAIRACRRCAVINGSIFRIQTYPLLKDCQKYKSRKLLIIERSFNISVSSYKIGAELSAIYTVKNEMTIMKKYGVKLSVVKIYDTLQNIDTLSSNYIYLGSL